MYEAFVVDAAVIAITLALAAVVFSYQSGCGSSATLYIIEATISVDVVAILSIALNEMPELFIYVEPVPTCSVSSTCRLFSMVDVPVPPMYTSPATENVSVGVVVPMPTRPYSSMMKCVVVAVPDVDEAIAKSGPLAPTPFSIESLANGDVVPMPTLPLFAKVTTESDREALVASAAELRAMCKSPSPFAPVLSKIIAPFWLTSSL